MRTLKIAKELELLLGGFGAVQSMFMASYIFFTRKKNIQNILLGLFFVMISLRIVKSLIWMYASEVPDWFINLGFTAHLVTAPALFLYVYFMLSPGKWKASHMLHFLPAMLLLVFLFKANEDNFWYLGGYAVLLYQQMGYTFLTLGFFCYVFIYGNKQKQQFSKALWRWLGLMILGAAAIQFAYFSNYILGISPYLGGPLVYAIFIYVIAIYAFSNQHIFIDRPSQIKYANISMKAVEFGDSKQRLQTIMQDNKPYLDANFNLNRLSKLAGLQPHLTSFIINRGFSTNFSDYTNGFRVQEAQEKLGSNAYSNIKIAEIAYECGFSSLSSFNIAFKKHTGTTPSHYKKEHFRTV